MEVSVHTEPLCFISSKVKFELALRGETKERCEAALLDKRPY